MNDKAAMEEIIGKNSTRVLNRIREIDLPTYERLGTVIATLSAEAADIADVREARILLRELYTDSFVLQVNNYYRRGKPFWEILEGLRNSLVFLPILITWLSLAIALKAYTKFFANSTSPFISLWQSGFGGQIPEWVRFSNVAWIDALVIGLIIFLTILMITINSVTDQIATNKVSKLQNELNMILWRLEQNLYKKYPVITTSESNDMNTIVAQLEKLLTQDQERAEGIVNYLAAEHERLVSFSDVQKESITELKTATTTFNQLGSQMVTSLNDLKQEIMFWSDAKIRDGMLNGEVNDSIGTLGEYIRIMREDTFSVTTKMVDILKVETENSDRLSKSITDLTTSFRESVDQISELKQETKKYYEEIVKSQGMFQDRNNSDGEYLKNIHKSINQTFQLLENMDKQSASSISYLDEIKSRIEQYEPILNKYQPLQEQHTDEMETLQLINTSINQNSQVLETMEKQFTASSIYLSEIKSRLDQDAKLAIENLKALKQIILVITENGLPKFEDPKRPSENKSSNTVPEKPGFIQRIIGGKASNTRVSSKKGKKSDE